MPTYVYAGASSRTGGNTGGVFRRAIDNGHWEHLTNGLDADTHAHAITVQPDEPSVVYAATSSGLYRSLNHGDRWDRVVTPAPGEQMWSVMIHPANHRTIMTGTAPLGLYRSDDGGDTWRQMPRPAIGERMVGAFPSRIMRLDVSPTRPDEIYAAMEVNGAMRSDDGGESWHDCSDELVRLSAADPLNLSGVVLAGKRVAAVRTNSVLLRDGLMVEDQAPTPSSGAAWPGRHGTKAP